MSEKDELFETMVSSEEIFHGRLLHIFRDVVRLPNGNEVTRELFKHWGAVCIVPLTEDGNIIMERQFRYPLNRVITEIPAGKLDSLEEDRLDAAKRELLEETGITADHWVSLGDFCPAAAYSTERITMYLATGLHKGERHLDQDEFLNIKEMPMEEVIKEIMDGTIDDGKTIAAVLKASRYLKDHQSFQTKNA
ncbi:MAG: NUDIX hydrolase [Lachnospiraceae bacterium]|nr:NUDIX hydrolase [Lachnospiraceae bacterium]MBR6357363.1 NUDIX hydrolase [Lachnospiraceae bacterium]